MSEILDAIKRAVIKIADEIKYADLATLQTPTQQATHS